MFRVDERQRIVLLRRAVTASISIPEWRETAYNPAIQAAVTGQQLDESLAESRLTRPQRVDRSSPGQYAIPVNSLSGDSTDYCSSCGSVGEAPTTSSE